jgi:hypothetical protein
MSTINLEVMKQLLQEFVEKETLAAEEIKVVQQQIEELEQRAHTCRDKLKTVTEDREKIAAMMQRYGDGAALRSDGPGRLPSAAKAIESHASPAEVGAAASNLTEALGGADAHASAPAPKKEAAPPTGKAVPGKLFDAVLPPVSESGQASPTGTESHNQGSKANEPQQPAEEQAAGKAPESSEETPDDTVKSINDALRGLFR